MTAAELRKDTDKVVRSAFSSRRVWVMMRQAAKEGRYWVKVPRKHLSEEVITYLVARGFRVDNRLTNIDLNFNLIEWGY